MTAQEFFKNDLFAENAGVVLLDIAKHNWKLNRNISTQGRGHREEQSSHWQTWRLPLPPTHTGHWLSHSRQPSLFYVQADRETLFMPPANATSAGVRDATKSM